MCMSILGFCKCIIRHERMNDAWKRVRADMCIWKSAIQDRLGCHALTTARYMQPRYGDALRFQWYYSRCVAAFAHSMIECIVGVLAM